MQISAALEILQLETNTSIEEIEKAYQTLYNEYKIRLDNSFEESQREKLKVELKKIEEAKTTLLNIPRFGAHAKTEPKEEKITVKEAYAILGIPQNSSLKKITAAYKAKKTKLNELKSDISSDPLKKEINQELEKLERAYVLIRKGQSGVDPPVNGGPMKWVWISTILIVLIFGIGFGIKSDFWGIFQSNPSFPRTISGMVTDEEGLPLIGAFIREGTSNGTITDIDGIYSLRIDSNTVVKFSYSGYRTTAIEVNKQKKVDVQLEEGELLEEVKVEGIRVPIEPIEIKRRFSGDNVFVEISGGIPSYSIRLLRNDEERKVLSTDSLQEVSIAIGEYRNDPGEYIIEVIDNRGEKQIKTINIDPPRPKIQSVTLGNRKYKTLKFEGTTWMIENLNYEIDYDIEWAHSRCYGDSDNQIDEILNCRKYGRLYTFEAAQKVCQEFGWRLPSLRDWQNLADNYGGIGTEFDDVGHKAYKALLEGGKSGFNALLGGGSYMEGGDAGMNDFGDYWSDSSYIRFDKESETLFYYSYTKSSSVYVRCVKD